MNRLRSIEALAIIGSIGAGIGPLAPIFMIVVLRFIWLIPLMMITFPLFLLAFSIGVIGSILGLRAANFLRDMPQRASRDFISIGIIVIIVGLVAAFNGILMFAGFLILVAGIDADSVWNQIKKARHQTGFPFATVATAAGNRWNRRLSCRYCGAPLVIRSADSRGHWIRARTQCPLDRTEEMIRLPLSQLEAWAPSVTDRLHRCDQDGERTVAQLVVHQTPMYTSLQSYCPNGHVNRHFRRIWTPLYPHLAQSPKEDVGFRQRVDISSRYPSIHVRFAHPLGPGRAGVYTQVVPQTSIASQPRRISGTQTQFRKRGTAITYCSQCGVRITETDKFCYRCGSPIN